MSEFSPNEAYSTTRVAEELSAIADRIGGSDAGWIRYAAERMTTLQGLCRPSKVLKRGRSYSVKVVNDDEGFPKAYFNCMQTFDDAIDFARIKYDRMKTGIQSVEITRDDDRSEYEPYSDDDPAKVA